MENGKLVIFSAPSGAGKTTIVHHLLKTFPELEFSVSATSRPLRGDESHGTDYYFFSVDEFRQRVANHEFVEWEEVYPGQMYGTLQAEVDRIWRKGHHVIFDVDVKGGINLKKYFGNKALAIFVKVPSLEVLKQRLNERGTETEESLSRRVFKAQFEMTFQDKFDVVLVNEDLQKSLDEAQRLYDEFK